MEKHNKITQQYFHKGISSRKDSHLIKNPAGRLIRPWWVKTVNEPTIEIDWNRMQRYDEGGGTVRNAMPKYIGTKE